MGRADLVGNWNKALSLELAGMIQNSQHSYLVTGTDWEIFKDYFRDQAEKAQDHAETRGDTIVALGGIPTVQPAMIRQVINITTRQPIHIQKKFKARRISVSGAR